MKLKKIISLLFLTLPMIAFAECSSNGSKSEGNSEAGSVAAAAEEGGAVKSLKESGVRVVDNLLISDNLPIVVDFNATWCPPCKRYSPIFHGIAEKYQGQAIFVSIDTDENPAIANAYKIESIPTTLFIMPGGGLLGKEVGLLTEDQLDQFVNQLIETSAGESGSI